MLAAPLTAIFESLWFLPVYLKRDKAASVKTRYVIIAVILGMTLAQALNILFMGPGNNLVEHVLCLDKTKGLGLLLHCIFSIGIGEELGKFLCGAAMLAIARPKKKTDYMFIIGAAGLGFSITEGILYAASSLTQIIRWIMPFHLMWQLLMGGHFYEFKIAAKAKNTGKAIREFLIAFAIPVLMHGVNDYLAIEASAEATETVNEAAGVSTGLTVLLIAFCVWIIGMGVFVVLTEKWALRLAKYREPAAAAEEACPGSEAPAQAAETDEIMPAEETASAEAPAVQTQGDPTDRE